jgi:hypothetical protein
MYKIVIGRSPLMPFYKRTVRSEGVADESVIGWRLYCIVRRCFCRLGRSYGKDGIGTVDSALQLLSSSLQTLLESSLEGRKREQLKNVVASVTVFEKMRKRGLCLQHPPWWDRCRKFHSRVRIYRWSRSIRTNIKCPPQSQAKLLSQFL